MSPPRNRLLARLDPGSLAGLEPHLKPIKLPLQFAIQDPGRRIEHAYFMDAGIASVVAIQSHPHDRILSDTIPLTHEFLALMLGVRRAGVTEALHALVSQGLVSASRGVITVLDRDGLEQSAGDSYGVPEAEYRRLIG